MILSEVFLNFVSLRGCRLVGECATLIITSFCGKWFCVCVQARVDSIEADKTKSLTHVLTCWFGEALSTSPCSVLTGLDGNV